MMVDLVCLLLGGVVRSTQQGEGAEGFVIFRTGKKIEPNSLFYVRDPARVPAFTMGVYR